ncbi:MAG: GNVR domain-containing protein [Limnochordales bacterium]
MEPDMARLNTEDDIIDLRQLWLALLRRRWIVAAACVLAVLAAFVITRMATPVYEARTTLLIKDPGASGERMFLDTGAAVVTRNQVQNSVQILRSRQVAEMAVARLGDLLPPEERQGWADRISVQPVSNTDTLIVSVQHTDARIAAAMANAVAESFIDLSRELNRSETTVAREFIEEQLQVAQAQLMAAEQALKAYREAGNAVLPSDETRTILNRLGDLEARLLDAQLAREDALRRGATAEAAAYDARIATLQAEIEAASQRLAAVPEREMTLAALLREQTVLEQVFLLLRGRLEEVRIAEAMRTSNVAVIDPAVPPTRPVSPRPMLNMALALFLGLFAGVAGALLLEFFDTTVKTPEEIGPLLGLPVLGRIPEERAGTDRS